jgi:hypothetical protein
MLLTDRHACKYVCSRKLGQPSHMSYSCHTSRECLSGVSDLSAKSYDDMITFGDQVLHASHVRADVLLSCEREKEREREKGKGEGRERETEREG